MLWLCIKEPPVSEVILHPASEKKDPDTQSLKMSQDGESDVAYDDIIPPPKDKAKEKFDMGENKCYGGLKVAPQEKATASHGNKNVITALLVLAVLVGMLIAAMTACCIAFALEITLLKSANISSAQEQAHLEIELEHSFLQLLPVVQQLNMSSHQQEGIQNYLLQLASNLSQRLDDLESIVQRPGHHIFSLASSCALLPSSSPSGYYWVRANDGSPVHVYCDMTRSCGNVTGGWMRVTELNMTDSSHQCPSGLRERNDSNIRTCVRSEASAGCSSIIFSSPNIAYSRICGRIQAYQINSTNAFRGRSDADIDSAYVDGVSLTLGTPREHIWTFAATLDVRGSSPSSTCPCNGTLEYETRSPAFVGIDYFCDSGTQSYSSSTQNQFYSHHPLWDERIILSY